jgi:hypothetical protein
MAKKGINMEEYVREELQRLNKKFDDMNLAMTKMAINIAEINTKIMSIPHIPERPCQWFIQLRDAYDKHIEDHTVSASPLGLRHEFDKHIAEHEEKARQDRQGLWQVIIKIIGVIATAAVAFFVGHHIKK